MGLWVPTSLEAGGLLSLEPESSHTEDWPPQQTHNPPWGTPGRGAVAPHSRRPPWLAGELP